MSKLQLAIPYALPKFMPPRRNVKEIFSFTTLRSYPVPSFFEKVDKATPTNPDREERHVLTWTKETHGSFDGYWYGIATDGVVVGTLRPQGLQFVAFYVGYGAKLEHKPATLKKAQHWVQRRHQEALAAQVEKMLEEGKV